MTSPKNPITRKRLDHIVKRLLEGAYQYEIAKELGISRQRVQQLVDRYYIYKPDQESKNFVGANLPVELVRKIERSKLTQTEFMEKAIALLLNTDKSVPVRPVKREKPLWKSMSEDEKIEALKTGLDEGKSVKAIAESLGISRQLLSEFRKKHGVELPKRKDKLYIGVRLPPELVEELDDYAQKHGISRAEVFCRAIAIMY